MEYFLELFFLGGLTRGSIYALIALGYTMVYGIIQLINFAHGEIYMIGAFTALIFASVLSIMGWPALAIFVVATALAIIYSSAYGFTIEKKLRTNLSEVPQGFHRLLVLSVCRSFYRTMCFLLRHQTFCLFHS